MVHSERVWRSASLGSLFCLSGGDNRSASCRATSGSLVSSARWCLLLLNRMELCILCWAQGGGCCCCGRGGWEGLCLLSSPVLCAAFCYWGGQALGGQKPSWFLQSLEFRKNWELEDLVTLENQTLISLSWWHFWALSCASLLSACILSIVNVVPFLGILEQFPSPSSLSRKWTCLLQFAHRGNIACISIFGLFSLLDLTYSCGCCL